MVFEREDGLLLLELIKSKLERKCDEFLLELTSIFDDVNFEGTSRTNMLFPSLVAPLSSKARKKGDMSKAEKSPTHSNEITTGSVLIEALLSCELAELKSLAKVTNEKCSLETTRDDCLSYMSINRSFTHLGN